MIDLHLLKVRFRSDISAEEERVIRDLVSHTERAPADKVIVRSGEQVEHSRVLIDGWVARAKDLQNGLRQYAEIHVPGDFPDLHSFTLKRLDHELVTMTPCIFGLVPHERLRNMTERYPRLTRIYWLATNIDAAIHREWTLSLGRRTAIARMANFFCEMFVRLGIVGLTRGNSYEFPLTQAELGETLGLTSVHVNRTLQELRKMNVIEVEGRSVNILDFDRLKAVAEFDDSYLYLEKRER